MVHTLIAFLLLSTQTPAQPADPAEPDREAPAPKDEAEDQETEEKLICRTIRTPSERVGQRFRKREVCQTQEEWDEDRRARR